MRIDKLRPPAQVRREKERILISTEAHGLASHSKAVDAERARIEAARGKEMAVALGQPHRGHTVDADGEAVLPEDRRWATPLGRFCLCYRLKIQLFYAGEEYERRVREARIADGLPGGQLAILDAGASAQTPEQAEARRDLARQRLADAKGILVNIDRRLPQAMTRLTFDALEPYAREEGMLKQGLYRLAVEWGLLKIGARDS